MDTNPHHPHAPLELTLNELVDRAKTSLEAVSADAADSRVRAYPDARTVRYYQSIGVVDRPLRYDGRRAIYGERHLLQAITVKVLQSEGYSLAQIQARVPTLTTEQLRAALGSYGIHPPAEPSTPANVPHVQPQVRNPRPVGQPHPAHTEPRWQSVEIAPGVLVSIDPRKADPDQILSTLRRALTTPGGTP